MMHFPLTARMSFPVIRTTVRFVRYGNTSKDARHIGAVAGMDAVMVETIYRTPYLPFRVYLRFSAEAATDAEDRDRAKFACFKE